VSAADGCYRLINGREKVHIDSSMPFAAPFS